MTELLSNADALAPKGAALTMAGKKTAALAAAGLDGAVATGVTAAGAAAAGAAPTIPMPPVRDQPNEHGGRWYCGPLPCQTAARRQRRWTSLGPYPTEQAVELASSPPL